MLILASRLAVKITVSEIHGKDKKMKTVVKVFYYKIIKDQDLEDNLQIINKISEVIISSLYFFEYSSIYNDKTFDRVNTNLKLEIFFFISLYTRWC